MEVNHGEKFVGVLEKAYAPYKSTVARTEIVHWANTKSTEVIRATYQELRQTFSGRYGSPPDLPDVITAYKAIKDTAEPIMALPDPDWEERKRTITPEERALGAKFFKEILEGMADGIHPKEVYARWLAQDEEAAERGDAVPDGGWSCDGGTEADDGGLDRDEILGERFD